MCLILEIGPDAEVLSQEECDDVWAKNPDGGCVIDTTTGEVIYRGLDRDAMTASVVGQKRVLAHWRHATSGPVDLEQTHGWRVGGGYLMHNGVCSHWATKTRSDTGAIVDALLAAGVDAADHDKAGALLAGIAGGSVIVVALATGGLPRWYGDTSRCHQWRGRWYSNHYAWSGEIHGKPPPVVDPRYVPLQSAWNWGEDDTLFPDVPRRRSRR